MTTLRAPGHNPTPRAVVRVESGRIALDMTCVTPAIRWYTLGELEAVNGRAAIAAACKTPEANDSGLMYDQPQPLAPIQGCALPPYMADNILALTEILNTRNPERQASRDLYVYELGYQIAEAVAA